ncbi:hypothetical protein V5O48_009932 [Marasmius crinis-equi]|uniref:Glycoside hydrolase family 76 protein n=1 Tax=Marasmius crinis-equi TaxID=585013 RepID=A0ABR3F9T0_9AGAR
MAQLDALTGQKTYQADIENFYKTGFQALNPDIDIYGYAALQAYIAYGDDSFLNIAEVNWQKGVPATITDSVISARASPIKNVTIASVCPNGGGVFNQVMLTKSKTKRSESGVSVSATGDFLILSASLAAVTSNRTYFDFAEASVEFIQRHFYQGNGLFGNYLNVNDCSVPPKPPFPYDTGCIIHALSLVASLTQNASTISFLRNVVAGATTYGAWHDASGILMDSGESLAHLMRGYAELYKGNNTPTDLKSYVKSYISNQYNAVTEISTVAGSNIYEQKWNGQLATQFSTQPQAAAISALLGGALLDPDDSLESNRTSASVPKGVIAGGVIGGVLTIGLTLGVIWFHIRRKRREKELANPDTTASPFYLTTTLGRTEKSRRPANLKQAHRPDTSRSTASDYSETATDVTSSTRQALDVTMEDLLSALNQRLQSERMTMSQRNRTETKVVDGASVNLR